MKELGELEVNQVNGGFCPSCLIVPLSAIVTSYGFISHETLKQSLFAKTASVVLPILSLAWIGWELGILGSQNE